jgi:hypothetical protein
MVAKYLNVVVQMHQLFLHVHQFELQRTANNVQKLDLSKVWYHNLILLPAIQIRYGTVCCD